MPVTTKNLYSVLGPAPVWRDIFGYQYFPARVARVTLAANQTSNPVMDNTTPASATLLWAGTPLGIVTATGKAALSKAASTDGSQIVYGILAWDTETAGADMTVNVYVTGAFRKSAIKLQGSDTIATLFALCPKYRSTIFIEDDIPNPAAVA